MRISSKPDSPLPIYHNHQEQLAEDVSSPSQTHFFHSQYVIKPGYSLNLHRHSLLSCVIDPCFQEAVTSFVSASGEAFGTLVEKTRTSLEELLTDIPEIVEGFAEMISTVVIDLWNNTKYALGYVTENA
ncbi:uncharacterized protein LOC111314434 isoform X2 [Durio zibethinus]|uniref:Uncharacterized protein LOC111314434 isoform X2 n=1 Tax=Durio zibethinus TaxID=66656 RepID=A0A6P6B3Q7_DURZI|nr:uncharacterized protein LOC111314434 isoform X2 [Durio zibethinus]